MDGPVAVDSTYVWSRARLPPRPVVERRMDLPEILLFMSNYGEILVLHGTTGYGRTALIHSGRLEG